MRISDWSTEVCSSDLPWMWRLPVYPGSRLPSAFLELYLQACHEHLPVIVASAHVRRVVHIDVLRAHGHVQAREAADVPQRGQAGGGLLVFAGLGTVRHGLVVEIGRAHV